MFTQYILECIVYQARSNFHRVARLEFFGIAVKLITSCSSTIPFQLTSRNLQCYVTPEYGNGILLYVRTYVLRRKTSFCRMDTFAGNTVVRTNVRPTFMNTCTRREKYTYTCTRPYANFLSIQHIIPYHYYTQVIFVASHQWFDQPFRFDFAGMERMLWIWTSHSFLKPSDLVFYTLVKKFFYAQEIYIYIVEVFKSF